MFRPNFEKELVEEESCEKNILLREPSHSSESLDAYADTHARTDFPTYISSLSHTHMHVGTRKMKTNTKKIPNQLKREFLKTRRNLRIRHLSTAWSSVRS